MTHNNISAQPTENNGELIKQRIDIISGLLFSVVIWGLTLDVGRMATGNAPFLLDGWPVGTLIAILGAPTGFAGFLWLVGRRAARSDFYDLPSAKWAWGVVFISVLLGLVLGATAQGARHV